MPRLCSESSRSYPGRSVSHAVSLSHGSSRLGPNRGTKVQASSVAVARVREKLFNHKWTCRIPYFRAEQAVSYLFYQRPAVSLI